MTPAATVPTGLPQPDADALAHAQAVADYLAQRIAETDRGFLPFDQWMQEALYAPGLGYYAAGSVKFGSALPTGDFTTAPEISPLFAQTLARQVAQVLHASGSNQVLEFGAGSGALATALIPALREFDIKPQYRILDVSADLQARQRQRLEPLQADVAWLDTLPDAFSGCVIANEVLDAMPASLFRWDDTGALLEVGVRLVQDTDTHEAAPASRFELATRPAPARLQAAASMRMPPLPGYQSDINLQAEAWIVQMGRWLECGAALLIDYGFPQREYYHPQRAEGTLMCHFRHHAHAQPLLYPGLQDITTHVDFTAMADAALEGGLDVLGYTSQARFLMNAGLTELLLRPGAGTALDHAGVMAAVQKLTSESEMGELFKVLAIGRNINEPLTGFTRGDRRDRL